MDKPQRPHSRHPNAHTDEKLHWIESYHRRNVSIEVCELYGKLRQKKAEGTVVPSAEIEVAG